MFWAKLQPIFRQFLNLINHFFKLGFTPCKAGVTRHGGMGLQEKEVQQRLKYIGNLFRKNLQLKDVC